MICYLVALRAEATPLIQHHKLEPRNACAAFPVYQKHDTYLIISGTGKCNAAAATAYLFSKLDDSPAIWLNIGIAGHANFDVGETFLAHKITDPSNKRSWYPAICYPTSLPSHEVTTVDQAEQNYPLPCLYDMEASGFIGAATRGASLEFVQSLKIVSDNSQVSLQTINKHYVSDLIKQNLAAILSTAESLQALFEKIPKHKPVLTPYLNQWHFTISQQQQLRELLLSWQVLNKTMPLDISQYQELPTAKTFLTQIHQELADLKASFINTQ